MYPWLGARSDPGGRLTDGRASLEHEHPF